MVPIRARPFALAIGITLLSACPSATAEAEPIYHRTGCSPAAAPLLERGMRAFWSFAPDDAEHAFADAARIDPNCAMAFWGRALALGNHMSNPVVEASCRPACGGTKAPNGRRTRRGSCQRAQVPHADRSANAKAAIDRARESTLPPGDRELADGGLIGALAIRISADPEAPRNLGAYSSRMRDLWRSHPDDADIGTLFALSLIDMEEKVFAEPGRLAKTSNISEATTVLTSVLAKAPDHLGANHILIHLLERSGEASKALPFAERLAAEAPDSGHLVHLYGHILLRLGRHAEAAQQFERAVALEDAGRPDVQRLYRIHTRELLLEAQMGAGEADAALATARALVQRVHADMSPAIIQMLDGISAMPSLVLVRFKRWEDVLVQPPPDPRERVATAIWRFTRVVAFARVGRVDMAEREKQVVLAVPLGADSTVINIAGALAEAEVTRARGHAAEAAGAKQRARQYQATLADTLPHVWLALELE